MDNTKKYRKLGDIPHLHVGKLIGKILNQKGITQAGAAKRLAITAPVFGEYLKKQSLQLGILWKISIALDYNLLADIMDDLPEGAFKNSTADFLKKSEAQQQEIDALKNELRIYKEIISQRG
jgi:transcriptional regulator with XRE-family HTH domain